jgi:hypothetical protein
MPDWLDKARQTITRSPGHAEPEPFERPCVCGETIHGERLSRPQQVPCPACGREWFILPLDLYPRSRSRAAKPSLWQKARAGGSSAEIATVPPPDGNGTAAAINPKARPPASPKPKTPPLRDRVKQRFVAAGTAARERVKCAAKPLRLVGAGILLLFLLTGAWLWHRARVDAASATLVEVVPQAEKAIQSGDPVSAERLLARAVDAVEVLDSDDATAARVRQRHRELIAVNGLAAEPPYDLAAQAERLGADPQHWSQEFKASDAGRWVILDVPLGPPEPATPSDEPDQTAEKQPAGKVVRLDLPLAAGKIPVRFEIDANLFKPIGSSPKRAIFAAQYGSWRLHGDGEAAVWVVHFRPETAFLWSSPDLLAARGFDLDAPGDNARAVLAAQSKALGVPSEGETNNEAAKEAGK